MTRRLLYLGGNGHCTARLDPARDALARLTTPFDLIEIPYPGFEDRPRTADFDSFLASVSASIDRELEHGGATAFYATGIGGLLLLCFRRRGRYLDVPIMLQAPVLWGLERRWMPRIMRFRLAQRLLRRVFSLGWFQRRFLRKQFERPVPTQLQEAFFAGYARCPAAPDLFAWITPALLRQLETGLAGRPDLLNRISVWWGGRDRVVDLQELAWTEQALGVRWPVREFPPWGHYPMIDEPDEWVRAVHDFLATIETVPGPLRSEAQ